MANDDRQDACEQAAEHFARLQSGNATEQDFAAARAWQLAAPQNESAWKEINALWDLADTARDDPEILAMRRQAVENAAPAPEYVRSKWPFALAACLTGVIALSGMWWTLRDRPAAPGQAAQVQQASNSVSQTYATPEGQQKTFRLSDGSIVRLNSGSSITVAMSPGQRDIRLIQGQAFFDVHKDPKRPFIVAAGALTAKAVGTAFDVNIRTDGTAVTTAEGLVQVDAIVRNANGTQVKARPSLVPAGSKLSLNEGALRLTKVDADRETLWTRGLVAFDAKCLGDVAVEMNRFSSRKLKVNPSAADIAISGVFKMANVEALSAALEQQGLVQVSDEGKFIYLSAATSAPPETQCARGA